MKNHRKNHEVPFKFCVKKKIAKHTYKDGIWEGVWEPPGSYFGRVWEGLGHFLAALGRFWGVSWAFFDISWPSLGSLGCFLGDFRTSRRGLGGCGKDFAWVWERFWEVSLVDFRLILGGL